MIQHIQQQQGPTLTGKWINTRTGETVTVKTMADDMSGYGAQVMLTDGSVMPFKEFSMYYVQAGDMEYGQPVPPQVTQSDIQYDTSQLSLDRDINTVYPDDIINRDVPSELNTISVAEPYYWDKPNEQSNQNKTLYNKEHDKTLHLENIKNTKSSMVRELLLKLDPKPKIDLSSVKILNIPFMPIQTMVQYFDVTPADIADAIYDLCFSPGNIKELISDYVKNSLLDIKQ